MSEIDGLSAGSKRSIRVVVNSSYLRPEGVGGSEVFLSEMIRELRRLPNLEVIELRLPGKYSRLRRLVFDNVGIWRAAKSARADVVWQPANYASLRAVPGIPQVLTVHDLIYRFTSTRRMRNRLRDIALRMSCSRADRISAVSLTTRNDLAALLGPVAPTIAVLGEGFRLVEAAAPSNLPQTGFLLYPAMHVPHKNHEVVLRALSHLAAGGLRVPLVLTGKETAFTAALRLRVAELEIDDLVDFRGFVTRSELVWLMQEATALVYPSRYEGFGLPVVEAMALGAPVVASDVPALREVGGEAASYVAADDWSGWADAISKCVERSAHIAELVSMGVGQAATHSWESSAARLAEVFRTACANADAKETATRSNS